jgi:hypothetical protein
MKREASREIAVLYLKTIILYFCDASGPKVRQGGEERGRLKGPTKVDYYIKPLIFLFSFWVYTASCEMPSSESSDDLSSSTQLVHSGYMI